MTLARALLAAGSNAAPPPFSLRAGTDSVELSTEAVLVFDVDGRIQWANSAARMLYGQDQVSPGQPIAALAASPATFPSPIALPDGTDGWEGELERRGSDGEPITVLARWAVRHDDKFASRTIVEFATELATEATMASLRTSEARYRRLFQRAPIALMLADPRGTAALVRELRASGAADMSALVARDPTFVDRALDIVSVAEANDEAVRMFGAARPSDLLQPVRQFWGESPETFRRAMMARFDGLPYFAEETRMRTLDGRTVDVLFSLTFPPQDTYMGATLMGMLDITERLRAEASLRQVSADFAQAARLSTLGEMTTSIAHEVKQPLSAMLTNAQTTGRWLNRAEPNLDKASQLLVRIAQSARHGSDIIDRIQDMAGAREPVRLPLDLNEVVQESLQFVRHEIENKHVHIRTVLEATATPVLGDRVQLQQIVVNLLVNSIQAMVAAKSPRREICLMTRSDVDSTVFTIRDSGPGIPSDHLGQVFDGFFTTKAGGLGIGLAICQSIIIAHGGRITAANHPKGGAVFEFCVPFA